MKYLVYGVRLLMLGLFAFLMIQSKAMLWLILFGVTLVLAPLLGHIYCGWVCPMNTLMVPTEWLARKLKLQTERIPKFLTGRVLPWLLLVVSLATMLFARRLLQRNIPMLLIWLAISLLMTLRFDAHVFHDRVCPFGAPQKLLGRFARFSERVHAEACIGCKRCERVCPNRAVAVQADSKKAIIDAALCLQCTNCAQICPTDAIRYRGMQLDSAAPTPAD